MKEILEHIEQGLLNLQSNAEARKDAYDVGYIGAMIKELRKVIPAADALQTILNHSNNTMATGSRDLLDWQDDNRVIGDIARNALKAAA